jgi:hypothetical protein
VVIGCKFGSRTPSTRSAEPVFCWTVPAYHHPNWKSALGGRSPTSSVLLVPSVASVSRVNESWKSIPSRRVTVAAARPATPR